MAEHGITAETLLAALPHPLSNQDDLRALGSAAATVLAEYREDLRQALLYHRLRELPEALLDILARDFKVDWWNEDYAAEEKRKTLRESWKVHRRLGTKAAVETAISAIYPGTRVVEWFEYEGAPYHFKLVVQAENLQINPEQYQQVIGRVDYYKNLRSVLDSIIMYEGAESRLNFGAIVRTAIQTGQSMAASPAAEGADWLEDEEGTLLADENGRLLIDRLMI